ncbi:MAG TPA: hypothetical protein VNL14_09130 [Candidatus Acidoferrales bacterium]|nr:hypothetical protein [Candidatus Acidoferrales bacterium]
MRRRAHRLPSRPAEEHPPKAIGIEAQEVRLIVSPFAVEQQTIEVR